MRKGFILPLLMLLVVGGICYYIFITYARTPNEKSKKTANDIYKYPTSTWQIKESKNLCLNPAAPCSQPVEIIFDGQEGWSTVYGYYRTYFSQRGWTTNSEIVTSIPTSIVFNNPQDQCQIALESIASDQFRFRVSCPD